jgi:polysaccharide export outer membrane protein
MEVSYVEGIATHNGLESCVGVCKDQGEVLTEERTGWVLSSEIYAQPHKRQLLRDADAVEECGRLHRVNRHRKDHQNPPRGRRSRACVEAPCAGTVSWTLQARRRARTIASTAAPVSRWRSQGLLTLTEQLISRLICGLAIATLISQVAAQTSVLSQAPQQHTIHSNVFPNAAPLSYESAALRIGTGDLLEISVSTGIGPPEVNWKGRVSGSGDIALPLVGSLHVLGLAAEQAEAMIETRYIDAEILKNPQVTVFISEYASQGISVLGEVAKPGVYPVMTSRRLLDLISQAGGFSPTAGRTVTVTHRGSPLEPRTVVLSRDPSRTLADNVDILPGDTIVVAKAGVVYVVGAVGKPGGFTMDANEGLTVLQAIALAEGSKPEASLDKSKLIRKTPNGPEEIPIPLSKILTSKAPDQKLQADDIVFVPSSAAKSAARRSLEAIVQTATGVAIYRR